MSDTDELHKKDPDSFEPAGFVSIDDPRVTVHIPPFKVPGEADRSWLLIDEWKPGTMILSYVMREWYRTIQESGDKVAILNSAEHDVAAGCRHIEDNGYDVIMWASVFGWKYYPQLIRCRAKKVCLWYDEPITRARVFGIEKQMCNKAFDQFVWDHYWRQICEQKFHHIFRHSALSAGPEFFQAESRLSNDIVFIGSLQDPQKLAATIEGLPSVMQKAIRHICARLDNPRDALLMTQDALEMMHPGDRHLFHILTLSNRKALSEYLQSVWSLGKNAVRMKALRTALKVAPVRMFTEPHQIQHATASQIEGMMGEYGRRFHVTEVSHADTGLLSECYHYGAVHLGATDPQSVLGGIPLRVFQTSASGRLLLNDWQQETADSFTDKKEILFYTNHDQLESELAWAVSHPEQADEMGDAARKRFESEHTWAHRLAGIKRGIGL